MSLQVLYLQIVIVSATISAILGGISLRYLRHTRAVLYFSPMMFLISACQITFILISLSHDVEKTEFWMITYIIAIILMVPFFLTFVLQYTGREKWTSGIRLVAIFLIPCISVAVACTNPFHHWMVRTMRVSMDGPLLYVDAIQYGWYFWIHTVYSYLLVLITILLILQMAVRSHHLYRQQAITLMLGVIPGVAASIVDSLRLLPQFKQVFTPLGFALAGIFFFDSINRRQLLNIVPIAREMLIENMGDGMLVLNESGQVVDINPAAIALLNVRSNEIIGQPARDVLREWRSLIDSYRGSDIIQGEVPLGEEDERRYCDLRISPILDRRANLIGRLLVLRDITQRKCMEEELRSSNEKLTAQLEEINKLHTLLQEQVIRDPLTGLFNRRYLNETLQPITERATRKHSPLSILMIDIDQFKYINDACGHAAGDCVLVTLCEKLVANVRACDLIYRYGGDEILILMEDTAQETAWQRAEMIRIAVESTVFKVDDVLIPLTVSIGVATYPSDGRDLWEVIDAADMALYEGKTGGRNRVESTGQL